jgi:hypothetical protein
MSAYDETASDAATSVESGFIELRDRQVFNDESICGD